MKEEQEKKIPSKMRLYLMVAALGLAYFFSNFHRLSLGVLGDVMAADFGLSAAELGILGSAFFYTYAVMQIPSGVLSDKVGTKYLISGSCLISGLATIWFGHSGFIEGLIAARAVTGLAVAFVYVPALAAIRYWFGDKRLGTMTGLLVAMGQIGAVSASTPLKLVSDALGWRNSFAVIGYISLALCLLAVFTILNPAKKERVVKEKKRGEWKIAFRPAAFCICIWFFFTGGARLSFQSLWGNRFFTTYLENTPIQSSTNLMWISVGCIFGAMVLGRVSDKLGSVRTLVLSTAIYALIWLAMLGLKPDSPEIFMALNSFAIGFLGAGSFTVGFTCVREFATASNTGFLTGVNNCGCFFGSAVFTQVCGSFVELFPDGHQGFFWLLVGFAVLCILSAFLVGVLNREKVFVKKGKQALQEER